MSSNFSIFICNRISVERIDVKGEGVVRVCSVHSVHCVCSVESQFGVRGSELWVEVIRGKW